jgi:hypothetical protein
VRSITLLLKYNALEQAQLEKEVASNTTPVPSVILDNTPPRRATRATEEQKIDRVSWGHVEKAGFTPCKGRSSNEGHRRRERECDGVALICHDGGVRSKCSLCGTLTPMYCTGCKNWLCFGSFAMTEAKVDKIMKKDEAVGSIEERPALLIRNKYFDKATGEAKTAWIAKNNCYSIKHKASFDNRWEAKHAEPIGKHSSIDTS